MQGALHVVMELAKRTSTKTALLVVRTAQQPRGNPSLLLYTPLSLLSLCLNPSLSLLSYSTLGRHLWSDAAAKEDCNNCFEIAVPGA